MCQKTSAATKRQGERGATAIALASVIALSAFALVQVVGMKAQNTIGATNQSGRSSTMRGAAESAAELVAQLAGNDIVSVSGTSFVQGGGVGALVTGGKLIADGAQLKPSGSGAAWRLDKSTGKIKVTTCMRPPENLSSSAFTSDNSSAWVASACNPNYLATTEVTPTEFHDKDTAEADGFRGNISEKNDSYYKKLADSGGNVNGLGGNNLIAQLISFSANNYKVVKIALKTELPGSPKQTANASARIALADSSRSCATDKVGCRTDHCPFMKEARLGDDNGPIRYKEDGTPYLVPNENFQEPLELTIDFAAHQPTFDWSSMSTPTALIAWYDEIFAAGRRNPFTGNQSQGTGGYFPPTTYYITFIPGTTSAVLNVPLMPDTGAAVEPGNVKFEAYLWKPVPPGDPSFNTSGSNKWFSWPKNGSQPYTYEDLQPYLKWGCKRTIGDDTPDFCTKIDVTYAQQSYVYPTRRQCTYRIPTSESPAAYNLPAAIANFRNQEVEEFVTVTGPTVVNSNQQLNTAVDDNRTPWQDNRPHVPYKSNNPDKCDTVECLTAVPFAGDDFNYVKVGTRVITYYQPIGQTGGGSSANNKAWDRVSDVVTVHDSNHGLSAGQTVTISGSSGGSPEIPDGDYLITNATSGTYTFDHAGTDSSGTLDWSEGDPTPLNYMYKKFVRTETFEVVCDETPWTTSTAVSSKDLTACIYLANKGVYDRSSCDQQQIPWQCRNGDGCFAADTEITMADGKTKPVQSVVAGDLVLNPMSLSPLKVVSVSVGDELSHLYRIRTRSGDIKVTGDHPIVTRDGVRRAEDVRLGTLVLAGDARTWLSVVGVDRVSTSDNPLVYNLTLETDKLLKGASHLVVANGLLSGDLAAQTQSHVREEIDAVLRKVPDILYGENAAP